MPWMTDYEIHYIIDRLNRNDIMLEWGAGGSTYVFGQRVEEYYSIEHDENWFKKIRDLILKSGINKINIHHIAPNKPLTNPPEPTQLKDYITFVNILNKKYDKVLLDGRCRVACAFEVIPFLKPNATLFLHDAHRERYALIHNKYILIRYVDNLGVFQLR